MRKKAVLFLRRALGPKEAAEVFRLSKSQEALERKWKNRLTNALTLATDFVAEGLVITGQVNERIVSKVIGDTLLEHAYAVAEKAIKDAKRIPPVTKEDKKRLAWLPQGKIPTNLKELRIWYDYYRKKGTLPPRQREIAKKLQDAYLKKVHSVWERYSDGFRQGQVLDQKEVAKNIRKPAGVAYARGQTIVQTETTRYYNQTRKAIYDQSDDITHYLMVAIRDHATTKWCKTRTGLVYEKNDPEGPAPYHWNCRSEWLPLSPLNPKHLALIKDKSKARRNNSPEPLPRGWVRK